MIKMNISPDIKNTIEFEKFSLSWRWDKNHNSTINEEEKRLIIPYSEEESKKLYKITSYFEISDKLKNNYEEFEWMSATIGSKANIQKVKSTLTEYFSNTSSDVIISWDRRTCVSTTKEIFIKYWDNFCYPSSDDVIVLSFDTNVILKYNHIEVIKIWRKIRNT
jgi:hypothetical protein